MFKNISPLQLVTAIGSILTGLSMFITDTPSILGYIETLFHIPIPIIAIWPLLMIVGGGVLLFGRYRLLVYRGYLIFFVAFVFFAAWRLLLLGPFWYPLVVVLLTFFAALTVARRG